MCYILRRAVGSKIFVVRCMCGIALKAMPPTSFVHAQYALACCTLTPPIATYENAHIAYQNKSAYASLAARS